MHTRTQEKGAVTLKETDPDLPVCLGVSSGGVGWWWPAAGVGALRAAVHAWDLLREVTIIFITFTIFWLQFKQQRGNTILPIRTRPSFPLSLSHQEASISILSFSIRGQAE